MMKIVAFFLLLCVQISCIHGLYIKQTPANNAEMPCSTTDSSSLPQPTESYSSSANAMTTEGPSALSLTENQTVDIMRMDIMPDNFATWSPLPPPSFEYLMATSDDDEVVEEKIRKITFAGRMNFRVRKNCRCIIHGRCARSDACD